MNTVIKFAKKNGFTLKKIKFKGQKRFGFALYCPKNIERFVIEPYPQREYKWFIYGNNGTKIDDYSHNHTRFQISCKFIKHISELNKYTLKEAIR
jgi:hypothetical protein